MKTRKILVFLILSFFICVNGSLLSDFITSAKNMWPKRQDLGAHQNKKLTEIKFELPLEIEEFLKEGLELINAPKESLDVCSHRVILQLKKNCNQLSQNDIGKLAVMLMNCEFESEGRTTYPCKPEMTLAQCTLPFDNNLLTIHAIMNNRALAVCAVLKQEQFKMATEAAVNHLMKLAAQQSQATQESLQNQRRANEISQQNIQEYLENYSKIKESQSQNIDYINSAKDQLSEINFDLQRIYEMNQHTEQKTMNIEKLTNDIAMQLESTVNKIQMQNAETQEFMERFKHIMKVISAITHTFELTLTKFEEIFSEIGLEVTQDFIVALMLNIFYLACGMMIIIAMDIRERTKLVILTGLFIFNILASYFNSDVPIISLNIFTWIAYICYIYSEKFKENIFMLGNYIPKLRSLREKSISRARSKTPFADQSKKPPVKKVKKSKETINDDDEDDEELASLCVKEIEKIEKVVAEEQLRQEIDPTRSETPINMNRPMTPAMARVMRTESGQLTPRSGTPYQSGMPGRIQCQALTKLGAQCRNAALIGYTKCSVHNYV